MLQKYMHKQKGMTLIELMIVVAIIGIISAIAYPSYETYTQKTRRVDAQGKLLQLSQWMERQFTINGTYPAALPTALVDGILGDSSSYYTLAFPITKPPTKTTYTLLATPVANSGQDGDECKILELDHTGAKRAQDSSGNAVSTTQPCWRN